MISFGGEMLKIKYNLVSTVNVKVDVKSIFGCLVVTWIIKGNAMLSK